MNTSPEMDKQRRHIRQFDDALMEAAIDHDMQYQVIRDRNNEIRGKKCTNCRIKLHRGHFHVAPGNHSVCCACVSKVSTQYGVKSLYTGVRVKGMEK